MKKILALAITTFVCANAMGAVSIRYHNQDSRSHTFKVKIDGSSKEVTFDSSRTSDVTIQGSDREATIYTSCGEVTVQTDSRIEIKDGCIKK